MLHRLYAAISRGVGRRGLLYLAALTAGAAGVIVVLIALNAQESPPQPSASAYGRVSVAGNGAPRPSVTPSVGPSSSSGPTASDAKPAPTPRVLPASAPTLIDIPAIDVHSDVFAIGKNPDGTLAVPQPGPDLDKVAWYDGSPTPGQSGPAVLEGHVDTIAGPSVFYRLGAMQPGDKIAVTRADSSTATFTVNAVRSYATHGQFPTAQIFGSDLAHPTLRLITCSNFDQATGHYIGNTVVFAHLTGIEAA